MFQRRAFSLFINKNKIPAVRAQYYNPEAPVHEYTHLKFRGDFSFVSFVGTLVAVGTGAFLVGNYKMSVGQKD